MFRKIITLIGIVVSATAICATAQTDAPQKYSFSNQGHTRTYTVHLPSGYNSSTPVVVYAHGYGSKRRWLPTLNAAADSAGMAVVYPDGFPDARGKDGWVVGYPGQADVKIDECAFFSALLDDVATRFGVSRCEVYLVGMSNGGDLCYKFMYTCPSLFKAYASVAGLAFENFYLPGSLTQAVPFMEIHGTADKTSMYTGDHANTGGWGAYIPVPLAVQAIAANNKCCSAATDTVPSLSTNTVTLTSYTHTPHHTPVFLYTIHGGKHSWAEKDLPTSSLVINFFRQASHIP